MPMKRSTKGLRARTLTVADLAAVRGGMSTTRTVEGGGRGELNGRPCEFPMIRMTSGGGTTTKE
jgi:hypothetical protein